jgi:hypothetical protein
MELSHLQTPTVKVTEKHTFIHVEANIHSEIDDSATNFTRNRPRALTAPANLLRNCCEALKDEMSSTDGCNDSTEYDSWDARSRGSTCSWPSEVSNDGDLLGAAYITQAETTEWAPGIFHQMFLPTAVADGFDCSATAYNTDYYARVCSYCPQQILSSNEPVTGTHIQQGGAIVGYPPDQREGRLVKNSCTKGALAVVAKKPTTVSLKKLPANCTLSVMVATLDREGFSGYFDFVHVPVNFKTHESVGYAQVNLLDHAFSEMFCQHFQGFTNWATATNTCEHGCVADVTAANQGIDALIDRYRNSALMHDSIPEEYKPALFRHGIRVQFPPPTIRLKAPRVRHSRQCDPIGEDEM